jgi:hypothetical protein
LFLFFLQRQDYKLRLKGKSSRLTDERMKLLNDLGFQWHIPRKGRKIKQKSIPVIKRDDGQPPAGSASVAQESGGNEAQAGTDSSGVAVSAAPFPALGSQNEVVMPQLGQQHALPSGFASNLSSVLGSSMGGSASSQATSGSVNNFSSATQQMPFNLESLLSLQRAVSSLSAFNNNNLAGSQVAMGTAGTATAAGHSQPQNATMQQPQVPIAAAFLALPIQLGDLLSTLQQQQIVPVSIPAWSGFPGLNWSNMSSILTSPATAQAITALLGQATAQAPTAAAAPLRQQQQQPTLQQQQRPLGLAAAAASAPQAQAAQPSPSLLDPAGTLLGSAREETYEQSLSSSSEEN